MNKELKEFFDIVGIEYIPKPTIEEIDDLFGIPEHLRIKTYREFLGYPSIEVINDERFDWHRIKDISSL